MLGDIRLRWSHWVPGHKSLPCLGESLCRICRRKAEDAEEARAELLARGQSGAALEAALEAIDAARVDDARIEGYAPVMLQMHRPKVWAPIVAILTQGAVKKIGPAPHKGLVLDISRAMQGNQKVMNITSHGVQEPLVPAFDIEPVLRRMWLRKKRDIEAIPMDLPNPIPIEEPRAKAELQAEFTELSNEEQLAYIARLEESGFPRIAQQERQKLEERLAKLQRGQKSEPTPAEEARPEVSEEPRTGQKTRHVISCRQQEGATVVRHTEASVENPDEPEDQEEPTPDNRLEQYVARKQAEEEAREAARDQALSVVPFTRPSSNGHTHKAKGGAR